ncbi:MAG: PilZ domain-containing protein [Rhizobiaceae bacterium]
MTALKNTAEDRRIKRHSVDWNGSILVGADLSEIRCLIRNISTIGVRLVVPPNENIPSQFHLKIPNGAKTFRCRLIWRKNSELGAEFVGTRPRWRQS